MNVPSLDDMRRMSDVELLRLRTEISYDNSIIEAQIASRTDDDDDEWLHRAAAAKHVHQRGLAAIKNIIVERGAERKSERVLPLAQWIEMLTDVSVAARNLLRDDEDEAAWVGLEATVEKLDTFRVEYDIMDQAER